MKIKLTEHYTLDQHDKGFTLVKHYTSVSEKGVEKPTTKNIGHFGKLEHAIARTIHLHLLESDETVSLSKYLDEYKNLQNELLNKVGDYG